MYLFLMQNQWENYGNLEINYSFTLNLVLFFPSWHIQHTVSGILLNFCSNYMVCFKMLMQKVFNVYIVFDILSNSILRAQSPECWETWETFHHLSNESPKHLANIPIKQSQKLPWWNEHYSIYAVTQQTDFPRVYAKTTRKMEL